MCAAASAHLCLFGSSDPDRLRPWQDGIQGSQEKLCSSRVALTLALPATAEEASVGPETNGRNTFSLQDPSFSSAEVLWNGRAAAYQLQSLALAWLSPSPETVSIYYSGV